MEKNLRVVLHRECSRFDSMLLLVKHTATMREANRSHDRRRCGPSVWIDTVSEQWPYPQCSTEGGAGMAPPVRVLTPPHRGSPRPVSRVT